MVRECRSGYGITHMKSTDKMSMTEKEMEKECYEEKNSNPIGKRTVTDDNSNKINCEH